MTHQFVVVTAAQKTRLVSLSGIREILPVMALTDGGVSRGAFRGMANVRGEIIPVFDMSGPEVPLFPSRFILISMVARQTIGLLVDEVIEVVSLEDEQVTEMNLGGGRLLRAGRLGDTVVPVLDPSDAVLDAV